MIDWLNYNLSTRQRHPTINVGTIIWEQWCYFLHVFYFSQKDAHWITFTNRNLKVHVKQLKETPKQKIYSGKIASTQQQNKTHNNKKNLLGKKLKVWNFS